MATLTDLYAQHTAHLQRYSTYTLNRIIKRLESSDRRLTAQITDILEGMTPREQAEYIKGNYSTRRLVKLRESIREMAHAARMAVSGGLQEQGAGLAGYEVDHSAKVVATAVGTSEIGTRISEHQAYSAAMSRPMNGRHVRDWVADLEPSFRNELDGMIRDGFVQGESVGRISRRIRGSAEQNRADGLLSKRNRKIETIVRTSMNHIANSARLSEFEALGVEKVRWAATLDGRTSKICASRDGQVWPVKESPVPPAHPNCRSNLVPYIGKPQGRRPYVADDRPVSKIPKDDREGKIGRVNASTNYNKWFGEQSPEFQEEWLGPSRYKLYNEGNYKIDRFVDPRSGHEYTLKELQIKDAATFAELDI